MNENLSMPKSAEEIAVIQSAETERLRRALEKADDELHDGETMKAINTIRAALKEEAD